MRKLFSILLAFLLILSVMHITVATHSYTSFFAMDFLAWYVFRKLADDAMNQFININYIHYDMDSTFILNTYQNRDSLIVCLDGEDFENEYGHMMGIGSMMGSGNREIV